MRWIVCLKPHTKNYLDSLVGIVDDSLSSNSSRPDNKKFFSFLKNCRQDSQGSAPLMKEGQLVTDNVVKTNLLNEQFQSVFTPKSPLKLKQLCLQKVQDLQDSGHYSPENVSTDFQKTHRNMKEIHISVNGIIKLLQGLKPNKAPGPDRIKLLLLQTLCLEIAPILQVIFSRSLDEGSLPPDWLKANVSPVFKKRKSQAHQIIGPHPFLVYVQNSRAHHNIKHNETLRWE